jgi:hypothetical protein
MLETWRMKKTGEIVHPIGPADKAGYTYVLFNLGHTSRKGNRGDLRAVKSDNLRQDKDR